MMKKLFLLALLLSAPAFSQITAPQVLGCTNPAPAAAGQPTVFLSTCKTPAFLPLATTSVVASVSKTAPSWAHSLSGYAATDKIVACPAGAIVSGASCTSNGADASALVAQSQVATFSISTPVTPLASGSLSWAPPTQNTDGSFLNDITNYKIYLNGTLVTTVDFSTVKYDFSNLTVGTSYTFSVSVVNSVGVESDKTSISQGIVGPKTPNPVTNLTFTQK